MADLIPEVEEAPPQTAETLTLTRKEKRKSLKKLKRKLIRQQNALTEIEEEEARLNDPEEQARIRLKEQEEAELRERQRREFEEREKAWLEAAAKRKAEDEERERLIEESRRNQATVFDEDDDGEYVEDGPPEIIWQGNEIIVRKRKVKVAERIAHHEAERKDDDRPTSNPLPPESAAFAAYNQVSSQHLLESVAQQTPNFGTEQDKAHCPFHLKTGACRFGSRCSRVHFYPDKSCTLLVKNMYSGPGLAWEQDEGLEYTDEEVEHCYEEFYEDVHTEFLKFGEIVNFKVCRNGSAHLRGNVYLHYKSLESAILAYNSINGRYFAGKQISCEYVGVTRWKVAICGEFMKSRLKACSRGSTCNFLHCFRNPGGDYEWADWDNPPPKHWLRKMAVLFGPSNDLQHDRLAESENQNVPRKSRRNEHSRRHHSRRSRSRRKEWQDNGSDEESSEKSGRRSHSSKILHSRPANSPEEYKQYDKDKSGDYHSSRKRKYLDDDSSRHHNHLNQSEQERDSFITLYGGHEDDSDLELNDKEQNNRRGRRSLRKTVDSPNFNEHCGTSKENGHGSYTSGRDSHEKRSYFDNSNRRRRRSSRRELSSRYEENIDADDHGRYAENYSCAAEDNEKHHSDDKSSGDDSSRSSRKRYAPDQKKEVKSLNDRTRLEDDDRVSKKYDSDYLETEKRYYKSRKPRTDDGSRALERSQDKNDNDGFEEHYRNLQSNADSGRGGSKRTVQEGGCLGEENNKPDRRASEKRRRSGPKDRHSSKTRKEETCDSHREASVANI